MEIKLNDKVALVTGASRGIGRAIALGLAGAGATVIVNYVKSKDKAEELLSEISRSCPAEAEAFKADVTNPDEVEALFEHVRKKYGKLDILVNNAGVIKDNLLAGMSLKEWDKVLDTNLRSAFLCMRAAVELMMQEHAGAIVNVASTSAIMGGRGQTNYCASKGGLLSFTRASAVELGAKGIRVNAVLPGLVVTDMTSRIRKRAGDDLLKRTPLGRFAEPHEIADLVVFLASDKAAYITGQGYVIDGGLSIT
jgi:3-oxoacyl-[acyl-carrier protein] reductase